MRRVHAACMALELFPGRGALRPELGEHVRLLGFERRVSIAYCVDGEAVEILGVFYAGRDAEELMRGGR